MANTIISDSNLNFTTAQKNTIKADINASIAELRKFLLNGSDVGTVSLPGGWRLKSPAGNSWLHNITVANSNMGNAIKDAILAAYLGYAQVIVGPVEDIDPTFNSGGSGSETLVDAHDISASFWNVVAQIGGLAVASDDVTTKVEGAASKKIAITSGVVGDVISFLTFGLTDFSSEEGFKFFAKSTNSDYDIIFRIYDNLGAVAESVAAPLTGTFAEYTVDFSSLVPISGTIDLSIVAQFEYRIRLNPGRGPGAPTYDVHVDNLRSFTSGGGGDVGGPTENAVAVNNHIFSDTLNFLSPDGLAIAIFVPHRKYLVTITANPNEPGTNTIKIVGTSTALAEFSLSNNDEVIVEA